MLQGVLKLTEKWWSSAPWDSEWPWNCLSLRLVSQNCPGFSSHPSSGEHGARRGSTGYVCRAGASGRVMLRAGDTVTQESKFLEIRGLQHIIWFFKKILLPRVHPEKIKSESLGCRTLKNFFLCNSGQPGLKTTYLNESSQFFHISLMSSTVIWK